MANTISTYIIFAQAEQERLPQLAAIQNYFQDLTIIDAVFPNKEHVPFLQKLIEKSKERTGKALLTNEIGIILSQRKVWRAIIEREQQFNNKNNNDANNTNALNKGSGQHYLILESDSKILHIEPLERYYEKMQNKYDIFFWGAWNGHVSIRRSTQELLEKGIKVGEPMIKSVYGAYGYAINAKGAKYLLANTSKISHPVDLYKHYVNPAAIKLGAIQPELIGTWQTTNSTIRQESNWQILKRTLIIKIFNCRNRIHAYFC